MMLGIADTDLAQTLDGGQAFRWRLQDDGSYRGVLGSRVVSFASCSGNDVSVEVVSGASGVDVESEARDYFNAGVTATSIRSVLSGEPGYGGEVDGEPVLRVLRQDPWECLAAFICSQNCNIPRIKKMVDAVARFGASVGDDPSDREFPSFDLIADVGEERFREESLGYRAKHLSESAMALSTGATSLDDLRGASYADAKSELMSLPGVGPKVADCVLAYSLDKREAFPVDVHVRRAAVRLYGLDDGMSNDAIGDWARDRFGESAALAQLYMFRYQINNR